MFCMHYLQDPPVYMSRDDSKRETVFMCDGWRKNMHISMSICVCVCARDICGTLRLLFCHIPSPSPCVALYQSQPSDIFRQLNSGTFQCHPLLSFLTGTAQTMMHTHCRGPSLPGSKLFFHCSIKTSFCWHKIPVTIHWSWCKYEAKVQYLQSLQNTIPSLSFFF